MPLRLVLAAIAFALALAAAGGAEARRLALVVGNSAYLHTTPLDKPARDAQAIAEALEALDFEVTQLTDAGRADLDRAIDAVLARAEPTSAIIFFYAGHAFQIEGRNLLVPVDARLQSLDAMRSENWSLDAIVARLSGASRPGEPGRQVIVLLDACRNDPRPPSVQAASPTGLGLAQMAALPANTLISFATDFGQLAYDGDKDAENSYYTAALLDWMLVEGVTIFEVLGEVRRAVAFSTAERQLPVEQNRLLTPFSFDPRAVAFRPGEAPPAPAPAPAPAAAATCGPGVGSASVAGRDRLCAPRATAARVRLPSRVLDPANAEDWAIIDAALPGLFPAPLAGRDLARALQEELRRVNCYRSAVDGSWGSGSRSALANFASRRGLALGSEPTLEILAVVRAVPDRVCPEPEPVRGTVPERERRPERTPPGTRAATPPAPTPPAQNCRRLPGTGDLWCGRRRYGLVRRRRPAWR